MLVTLLFNLKLSLHPFVSQFTTILEPCILPFFLLYVTSQDEVLSSFNFPSILTFPFPSMFLPFQTGHPIDTDTNLQRAIYAAKSRIQRAVRGERGAMEPGDWRLPHAPVPARPDLSRVAPLPLSRVAPPPLCDPPVPRRPPHRLGGISNKAIRLTQSMPLFFVSIFECFFLKNDFDHS